MLFVSFFPQILSGPISKAKDLLPQIKADRQFDYTQAVSGMKFLLWGMFLKVVMADRLGLYVDIVFDNWLNSSSMSCLIAGFFYPFQIYGDFAGYSLMAVGVGRLLGFELINNFNRPYFSVSVTDFWHRWHISLSSWLKDYIYIPLGGNRCSKARNYFNIILTFLVSGIWHGANWTFVVWGVLHGVFQVIEKALGLQRCERKSMWVRLPRIIVTFILISFLWTVFRASSISDWCGFISRIFVLSDSVLLLYMKILLLLLGLLILVVVSKLLEKHYAMIVSMMRNRHIAIKRIIFVVALFLILFIFKDVTTLIFAKMRVLEPLGVDNVFYMLMSIVIVSISEFCQEFVPSIALINNKHIVIRWLTYVALVVIIMLTGVLDSSQFIYVRF